MTKRSYGQYCALAKTLDLVGERWTLLVVRELIFGPRRYSDVLQALPGIGTSLLAERLKNLEAAGVVRRRELPPPAASTVYELTDSGADLARALLPLVMWGARNLLTATKPGEQFRVVWPLLVVRETFDRSRAEGVDDTYEFVVEGSVGHLRVHGGRIDVREGPAPAEPDVRLTMDAETFVAVGTGRLEPAEAIAGGRALVEGDPDALVRLFAVVGLPDGSGQQEQPARR